MLFYSDSLPLSTPRSKKLQLEQESRFTGNYFISGANYYTLLLYIALYIILYYTYTLYLWLLHTIPSWWENSLIFFFGAQKVFFTLENDRLIVLISRMRLHSLVLIMFLMTPSWSLSVVCSSVWTSLWRTRASFSTTYQRMWLYACSVPLSAWRAERTEYFFWMQLNICLGWIFYFSLVTRLHGLGHH